MNRPAPLGALGLSGGARRQDGPSTENERSAKSLRNLADFVTAAGEKKGEPATVHRVHSA
jgi:hypothetical protein